MEMQENDATMMAVPISTVNKCEADIRATTELQTFPGDAIHDIDVQCKSQAREDIGEGAVHVHVGKRRGDEGGWNVSYRPGPFSPPTTPPINASNATSARGEGAEDPDQDV